MLGVGWTEMLVIGIVALVVIGPKELPGLMKKLGQFTGQIRRMGQDFQRELNKTTGLDEVRNLRSAITEPLKATTDAIRKEFNTTTASGTVQPSGVLKPADPKVESVVSEIHKMAGMTPPAEAGTALAEGANALPAPVAMEPIKGAPVKAASTTAVSAPPIAAGPATLVANPVSAPVLKAEAAPSAPIVTAELASPAVLAPAKKAVESPAPVEAIAPADGEVAPKPKRVRKKPAAKAE
ncbi:MAG TPA: Sec-independent protein translocase protein TatB [Devosia sp.]|nr:Sec-independent protein translocase protein TatB [Devosia sp.]